MSREIENNNKNNITNITNLNKQKKYIIPLYCSNCGIHGHVYKTCSKPITSYGIILFELSDLANDETVFINRLLKHLTKKNVNIMDINRKDQLMTNERDLAIFSLLRNRIKFLLIRRKHTLGYIEFIRGRYKITNVDGIIFLFKQMVPEEIKKIGEMCFDKLWDGLWGGAKKNCNYREYEYKLSKEKFAKLKNCDDNRILSLDFYVRNVNSVWNGAEWGFPKGRRNNQETNLDCAIREFSEESGYTSDEYLLLNNIEPLEENLTGTDGKPYKHIYFVAMSTTKKSPTIDSNYKPQSSEIGDIGWYTHYDSLNLLRVHHLSRKKILTELYKYIIKAISNVIEIKK
jgi:ADP-ribose pyrophosphatase YjhB (NUDIX family)